MAPGTGWDGGLPASFSNLVALSSLYLGPYCNGGWCSSSSVSLDVLGSLPALSTLVLDRFYGQAVSAHFGNWSNPSLISVKTIYVSNMEWSFPTPTSAPALQSFALQGGPASAGLVTPTKLPSSLRSLQLDGCTGLSGDLSFLTASNFSGLESLALASTAINAVVSSSLCPLLNSLTTCLFSDDPGITCAGGHLPSCISNIHCNPGCSVLPSLAM